MRSVGISRRKFVFGTSVAAAMITLMPRTGRSAAKYTFRFSDLGAENNPDWPAYTRFKEFIAKESGGEMELLIYPNSQLGNEREATEQVKLGAIEMTAGGGDIQGYVPEVGLFYLPFLFPTDACFASTWDIAKSPVAQKVADIVLKKSQTIRALSYLPAGATRNLILRSKPVNTLADFKGVKIRVDTAPTSFKTMQALGAAPAPMAFPDVYNALQTGVIDAADNSLDTFIAMRWAEVCKYVSITDHNRTLHVCMINEASYQALPDKFKEIMNEAARTLGTDRHTLLVDAANASKTKLETMGLKINTITDTPAWVAAAAPLQDEWAKANSFEAELAQVRKMCA